MTMNTALSRTTIDVEDVKLQEQANANSTEICFVGYVLDTYCIDRGTLLDNRRAASLEEPWRHSIHCLVDVPRCVHSGYELLLDPPVGDGDYCRAFQLDERGNELLLELARSTGEQGYCTTCSGPPGSRTNGFRATVYGTIEDSSRSPPLLQVSRVASIRDGCQGSSPYIPSSEDLNCNSGSYLPFVAAHGSLMLISWGFLLPLGVISAKLLKDTQRPESALWFHIHKIVQPAGIIIALAGWITALAGPFNILGSGVYDFQFVHALMGTIVMGLGLLQPINAFFRPHKIEEMEDYDESALRKRRRWEWGHRCIGYMAIVLGLVNCFIGMALSGKYQDKIFTAIVVAWAFLLFYGLTLLARRSYVERRLQQEQQQQAELEEGEENGMVNVVPADEG